MVIEEEKDVDFIIEDGNSDGKVNNQMKYNKYDIQVVNTLLKKDITKYVFGGANSKIEKKKITWDGAIKWSAWHFENNLNDSCGFNPLNLSGVPDGYDIGYDGNLCLKVVGNKTFETPEAKNTKLDISGYNISMSVYVKFGSNDTSEIDIEFRGNSGVQYSLNIKRDLGIQFVYAYDNVPNYNNTSYNTTFTNNTWYKISVVCDNYNNQMRVRIFLNDILVQTSTFAQSIYNFNEDQKLYLKTYLLGGGQTTYIDDLYISNDSENYPTDELVSKLLKLQNCKILYYHKVGEKGLMV